MSQYVKMLTGIIFGIFSAGPCHASSLLIGDVIQTEYDYPSLGAAYPLATVSITWEQAKRR
jgi:hypothetical protein